MLKNDYYKIAIINMSVAEWRDRPSYFNNSLQTQVHEMKYKKMVLLNTCEMNGSLKNISNREQADPQNVEI